LQLALIGYPEEAERPWNWKG